MSGVAGAQRVKSRADFQHFLQDYKKLISQFPGFVGMTPSGSYNSNLEKQDFGDIDLIVHIKSPLDKAQVKKQLQAFFMKEPETKIVPFTSEKHAGKRTYNAGELVSVRYHDDELGYSAQIDNIIALDQSEASFKQQFLDMPAEKQGLVLGLTKVATIETDPQMLFRRLGIRAPVLTQDNEEYEFNLSSVELQLRKITYKPGTYEQLSREVVWSSKNFNDLQKLLFQYDLDGDFSQLLAQSKSVIKNPRSSNRIKGVFDSMISVKSGEVGTAKGAGKQAASSAVHQTFKENRSLFHALIESAVSRRIVFAFGRFQPPTIGHELLINTVKQIAETNNCSYVIYVSRTQDHKANPLDIGTKMHYLKTMFPGTNFTAADDAVRTPIEAARYLNQNSTELIMVAGDDRVDNFQKLLDQYNGKEYNYSSIQVVSAGTRDPDADTVEGMSGTKMRNAALANDFNSFQQGLPATATPEIAKQLMADVANGLQKPPRKNTKVKEEMQAQIDDNWFKQGGFQTYKKANPIKYQTAKQDGVLKTLEGPVNYKAGYKIVTGPKGEQYPIPPEKFAELYDNNTDGTATPKKIMKMAKLADHDGVVNTSWGEPLNYTAGNDYIVRHGPNNNGVVKKDIFPQTYATPGQGTQENRDRQGTDVTWKQGMPSNGYPQTYHNTGKVGGVAEEKQKLYPKTKLNRGVCMNNRIPIGESLEIEMSLAILNLLENQLNELQSYATHSGYNQLPTYKRYNIFVSKKKFNNIAFIAVAENPRTKEGKFRTNAPTQQEAIAKLHAEIDKEIDVAQKVSNQATLDFNVDFVREILEMSDRTFYAKVVPGPKLIMAGSEMENYPEIMRDEGFKKSTIRTSKYKEGSTKLPGIPLSPKEAIYANLIANGRYVLGNETVDKDGNRVFDLEFDSVVADKGEKLRMRAPAFTVGTNR